MDFLLLLGTTGAAITKYLYGWLNKWSAESPPRAPTVAEAHSKDQLSLSITALYRQNHLAGARPGKGITVGAFVEK